MAGVKMTFCMYLSMVGAVFFFFLALCCFVGMEALHLPKGKKVQRGMEVFAAGLVLIYLMIDLCWNSSVHYVQEIFNGTKEKPLSV